MFTQLLAELEEQLRRGTDAEGEPLTDERRLVPYAFGSFGEWIETLGRLRDMDPQIIVPGHGDPQRDFEYLDRVRDLLRFTLDEVRAAAGRGLDLEGVRQAVDLTGWRRRFTGGDPTRELGFNRAWDEIHGRLDEQPRR